MTMLRIDIPRREKLPEMAPGSELAPGRNSAALGLWLCEKFLAGPGAGRLVIDPMCGVGQWWQHAMRKYGDICVLGCELDAERVALANQNGLQAVQGLAEEWRPDIAAEFSIDLVAFSPRYPKCNKNSGKNEKQVQMVKERGAHSMQKIEGSLNLLPVFLNIASYRRSAPVAVVVKDYVEDQIAGGWVDEVASSMAFAGLGPLTAYYREVLPGMTEQWKVSANPRHRWIDREVVLVGGLG